MQLWGDNKRQRETDFTKTSGHLIQGQDRADPPEGVSENSVERERITRKGATQQLLPGHWQGRLDKILQNWFKHRLSWRGKDLQQFLSNRKRVYEVRAATNLKNVGIYLMNFLVFSSKKPIKWSWGKTNGGWGSSGWWLSRLGNRLCLLHGLLPTGADKFPLLTSAELIFGGTAGTNGRAIFLSAA